jgi:hypothetical protein
MTHLLADPSSLPKDVVAPFLRDDANHGTRKSAISWTPNPQSAIPNPQSLGSPIRNPQSAIRN